MSCPACERANAHPRTGVFQSGCLQCDARQIAAGPQAKARERDPAALQALMHMTWPEQAEYQKGRVAVWAWIQKLEGVKA